MGKYYIIAGKRASYRYVTDLRRDTFVGQRYLFFFEHSLPRAGLSI
jgi:hypothetical protein